MPKVQSKSNRKQGSAKPKKTKSTQRSFPSSTQQENAFVTGKVNDCPTKLLVFSGACISVINYEFIKKVLQKTDAHQEVTPSTFPEVHTVSGEKVSTIGQIQVTLLLNGRQFPYQAVLGRDFLQSNGAIVNFSKGTLKLDKTYSLKMTLGEERTRPLAILTFQENRPVARRNSVSKLPHYYSAFIHRCKKARHFFLKFLIILLLMSPHSHVNSQITQESTTVLHKGSKLVSDPEFTKSSLSHEQFESKPPSHVKANHRLRLQFLFLLTPVRLKDSSIITGQSLKLPEKATAIYERKHQEQRNIPDPDP